MRAPRRLAGLLLLLAAVPAAPAFAADGLSRRTLYHDGPNGRYLVGGTWLFRLDTQNVGTRQGFARTASTAGWSKVKVPNAWNATDESNASMTGTTAWYRKDFRLPSSNPRLDWIIRFESVNYRARVYLNGRKIGSHTGAYLPWEVRLRGVKRGATNRLVIRVNNHRGPWDFPPSRFSREGVPTGGWWNYGGLLREVYLRRVDRIDLSRVQVRPDLPCATCQASINYRVTAHNLSSRGLRVHLSSKFGTKHVDLGTAGVGPGGFRSFTARVRVKRPRLWSPTSPYLYRVTLNASVGGRTVAHYGLHSGIRSIKVVGGHLYLNGQPANFRGVGLQEDSAARGFAIGNATRNRFIAEIKDLGATVIRAHYPLHPELLEQADRQGLLVWSEIPVYGIKTQYLKRSSVRRLATEELRDNILANSNHPSIMLWSIGNELSSRPGPVQGDYIRKAVALAHGLDPGRPVGIAVAAYPSAGCQTEYGPLDVIGVNEYFGWYPGPGGQLADREALSPYLDSVRACYPNKAIVVSEFGAEANRDGPVEEKGTYQFQEDFVNYHLGVLETKPWLSGVIYWALEEFRVRPGWDGGDPHPDPPWHEKGLISRTGQRKPAFTDVQREYRATQQWGAAPARRR